MTGTGTLTYRKHEVISLWSDGHTGAQIAAKMGNTSRGGVIAFVHRLRATGDPALLAAEAKRSPPLNRKAQVAEWIAEHDGKLRDCAAALGFDPKTVWSAWKRVKKDCGGQAV